MFGSQALETAIGLAAMFFIVATAASAVAEFISRIFSKRAKDLEKSLAALFKGKNLAMTIAEAKEVFKKQKAEDKKRKKEVKSNSGAALTPEEMRELKTRPKPNDMVLRWLKETSVWQSAAVSSGRTLWRRKPKGPSYLSAKLFADAVAELLLHHSLAPAEPPAEPSGTTTATAPALGAKGAARTEGVGGPQEEPTPETPADKKFEDFAWPENLKRRLEAMVAEGRTDLVSLKAGLESWFDEAMSRTEGAYKRWATLILFVVGLFLAVFLNLSTVSTAAALWQDPVTREAVANSATALTKDGTKTDIKSVAQAAQEVESLKIPGGWNAAHQKVWSKGPCTTSIWAGSPTWPDGSSPRSWSCSAPRSGSTSWADWSPSAGRATSPIRPRRTTHRPLQRPQRRLPADAATNVITTGAVTPVGPATDGFARTVGLIK